MISWSWPTYHFKNTWHCEDALQLSWFDITPGWFDLKPAWFDFKPAWFDFKPARFHFKPALFDLNMAFLDFQLGSFDLKTSNLWVLWFQTGGAQFRPNSTVIRHPSPTLYLSWTCRPRAPGSLCAPPLGCKVDLESFEASDIPIACKLLRLAQGLSPLGSKGGIYTTHVSCSIWSSEFVHVHLIACSLG